jgi:hypothetical protein
VTDQESLACCDIKPLFSPRYVCHLAFYLVSGVF